MIFNIEDRFEIRPYNNGLCWEIYEYKTVKPRKEGEAEREEWVHTGKYPSTLGHALNIILEDLLREGDKTIYGLKAMRGEFKEAYEKVMAVVEGGGSDAGAR